jgi:hypothetical protein
MAFGPSPQGVIIFSKDGHFSLFQSRAEIPKIAANDGAKANTRRSTKHRSIQHCVFRNLLHSLKYKGHGGQRHGVIFFIVVKFDQSLVNAFGKMLRVQTFNPRLCIDIIELGDC